MFIDQIIALFFDEYLGAEPAEEGFTLEIEYYLERNTTKHVVCDRYSYDVVAFVSAVQTFRRRSIILVTHPWLVTGRYKKVTFLLVVRVFMTTTIDYSSPP